MPTFTIPIHEHGTPGQPNYPHPLGRDAFVPAPRPSPTAALLEPYGDHARTVAVARVSLTRRMAVDGNEHMVVVQPGKEPFYHTSGSPVMVEMPHDGFMDEMRDNPPIFTAHTHPTGSAPSLQDLRMQVRSLTKRQIIFGEDGEWYEFEITDFGKGQQVIEEGRRYRTYWEKETKGKFAVEYERLRKSVVKEAGKNTDAWAAQKFGWTVAQKPGTSKVDPGFRLPDGSWINRKAAGQLHPEIRQHHVQQFAELSPRIWLKLREKHTWFKFRHYRKTGPYATSTH